MRLSVCIYCNADTLFQVLQHVSEGHSGTYFDVDDRYGGLGLVEVACNSVHRLWYIIQHQIQIHFIFL